MMFFRLILTTLATLLFSPLALASASPACGDFLAEIARKPPGLGFVDCTKGDNTQLRSLVARYRVQGGQARDIERYLIRHARMARLHRYCCVWEPSVQGNPRYGSFSTPSGSHYEVIMESDETVIRQRAKWREIPWFHVLVTLYLDEP